MRVLVTGGSGVLGRSLVPHLVAAGHDVSAPAHDELDLLDPAAVEKTAATTDAVYHLATRIPPPERFDDPGAWRANDLLRRAASRILVDVALSAGVTTYVQPSVAFVYPIEGPGRRGVALRLELLDGPGTGIATPARDVGATLHVEDAGRALHTALRVPSRIYNVCRNGERISNARFVAASGWRPRH